MFTELISDTKLCVACNEERNLSFFAVNRATKDGLQARCKSCDNFRQAVRRFFKQSEINSKAKEYQRERRKDNNYRIQMLLNASKQRAAKKNREHSITVEDIVAIWPLDNRCPVFGFVLEWNEAGFRETSPSIDRIDSNKGYTKDNVQIISWKANRIKSYATVEELQKVVKYMEQGANLV